MNPRRLWTLMRREMQATFRDPFTVTILIAVPIVALMLFTFILSTEVKHLALGFQDVAQNAASRRLLADLAANGTFDLTPYRSADEIGDALVSGKVSVGIVIPPDFGAAIGDPVPGRAPPRIRVMYDGGEAVLAGNAEGFLRSLVAATAPDLVGNASEPESRDAASGADRQGVAVAVRALFNPRLDGKPFMVAGVFGFVLSFLTTLITAVSIVNERLTGTFEQLQVTPATSLEILLGKLLPLGAIFALDVALMVLVAGFVLGVWPAGSVVAFVAVSAFYVLISLALGLLFSATSATPAEAVQKTVLFSIPLVQLSGYVFPVRNMPDVVQWLSMVLPATHYIEISRAIYLRAEGPLALVPHLAYLLLVGMLLIFYALRALEARA
jgi:ABC-type multidrug transport system permease subunit